MAVRSDCSASSGLTSNAGGVRRPARCRAASTSAISERRESSERANLALAGIERAKPRLGVVDAALDAAHPRGNVDQLRIELAAILADRRDLGLELVLQLRRGLLLRAGGLELLLALLDEVGVPARRPAASAGATWARATGAVAARPSDARIDTECGARRPAHRPRGRADLELGCGHDGIKCDRRLRGA